MKTAFSHMKSGKGLFGRQFKIKGSNGWFIMMLFCLLTLFPQGGPAGEHQGLSMQVLYDNYVYSAGCQAEWGYACLIQTEVKRVLFDTGRLPRVLLHNMTQLQVDSRQIDAIVISHNHADHTGGLLELLRLKPDVTVYLPASISDAGVQSLRETGASVFQDRDPVQIAPRMWLSGAMQSANGIFEQALFVQTSRGLVVLTGCAHPGVIAIIQRAKKLFGQPIDLVAGGFHLTGLPEAEIREVIRQMQELDVARVGPSHCTGDRAIALFKEAYAENFVQMGVGRRLMWDE